METSHRWALAAASAADNAEPITPVSFQPGARRTLKQLLPLARAILKARGRALRVLPRHVFRDEAWDMLLALLIAEHEGRATLVKELISASTSSTSGMRRIEVLEEQGLLKRTPADDDHRRVHVRLTAKGHTALVLLLEDIAAAT